jgi:hypothetical protein
MWATIACLTLVAIFTLDFWANERPRELDPRIWDADPKKSKENLRRATDLYERGS